MSFNVLNARKRSLLRGTLLVLGSLAFAFLRTGFPNDRPSLVLLIPVFATLLGTFDTARCLQGRWSFYNGAVLLLLSSDILALIMILFLLMYPYGGWLQGPAPA